MSNNIRRLTFIMCCLSFMLVAGCNNTPEAKPGKLDQPKNLNVNENYIITWDAVNGAKSYGIRIGKFVDAVSTPAYDASKALVEGENHVFIFAIGDNETYFDSDASFILVNFSKYTEEEFNKAVTDILVSNGVTSDEASVTKYVNNINKSLEGTKLDKDAGLTLLKSALEVKNGKSMVTVFNDLYYKEYDSKEVATYSYNALLNYCEELQNNQVPNATLYYYMLSGNKPAFISSFETLYDYLTNFSYLTNKSIDVYNSSSKDAVATYKLYNSLLDAVYNNYKPTLENIQVLTKAARNILSMFKDQGLDQTGIDAVENTLILIETVYEPLISSSEKTLRAVDEETFNKVYTETENIITCVKNEGGINLNNKDAITTSVNNIKLAINSISIDVSKENQIITDALNTYKTSGAIEYFEEALVKLLEQQLANDPNAKDIADFVRLVLEMDQDNIYPVKLISQMLKIMDLDVQINNFIESCTYKDLMRNIIATLEGWNMAQENEYSVVSKIIDLCLNDPAYKEVLVRENLVNVLTKVKELINNFDFVNGNVNDLEKSIVDTLVNDSDFRTYIKKQQYGEAMDKILELIKNNSKTNLTQNELIKESLIAILTDKDVIKDAQTANATVILEKFTTIVNNYDPKTSLDALADELLNVLLNTEEGKAFVQSLGNPEVINQVLNAIVNFDFDQPINLQDVLFAGFNFILDDQQMITEFQNFIRTNLSVEQLKNLKAFVTNVKTQFDSLKTDGITIAELSEFTFNYLKIDPRIFLPAETDYNQLVDESLISIINKILNILNTL